MAVFDEDDLRAFFGCIQRLLLNRPLDYMRNGGCFALDGRLLMIMMPLKGQFTLIL
jgi:hypothetical protein